MTNKSKNAITPYIFFAGRCAEALEFYKSVLDAKIGEVHLFKNMPDPLPEGMVRESFGEKIMHAEFWIRDSFIMASDGCSNQTKFSGFALSLAVSTKEDADKIFTSLSSEGKVNMPLGKTFYSPYFGMVTDKFGIDWMLIIPE